MRKLSPYTVSVFSGQNDRDNATQITPDQAQKAQNVFTDEINGISSQPWAALKASIAGGAGGTGLWAYKTQGGQDLLIAYLTGLGLAVSPNGTDWTPVDGSASWVTSQFPEGISYDGLFWLCTGNTDIPLLSFDGTDWLPAGAPKLAAGAAGNPDGTYRYIVTFTVVGEEIQACKSFPLSVANYQINLTKIPLGPENMTKKTLYRTKNTGTGDYLKVTDLGIAATVTAQINPGDTSATVDSTLNVIPGVLYTIENETVEVDQITSSTAFTIAGKFGSIHAVATTFARTDGKGDTEYIDNIADASLTSALTTSNPGIPAAYYPVGHQGRIHLLKSNDDPGQDAFSIPGFGFLYPGNNTFDVPLREETMWGGFSFKETLIIATGLNLGVLSGDNVFNQFTFDWRVRGIGCLYHRSMQTYYKGEQQFMVFRSADGYYLYDGSSNPAKISDKIQNTVNSLLGPDLNYGSRIFTTETDWETGNITPSGSLDTTTYPDQIQLAALPPVFTDPAWISQAFQYLALDAANFPVTYRAGTLPAFQVYTSQGAPIRTYQWKVDTSMTPQEVDTMQISFQFSVDDTSPGGFPHFSDFLCLYFVISLVDYLGNELDLAGYSDTSLANLPGTSGTPAYLTLTLPKTKIAGYRIKFGLQSVVGNNNTEMVTLDVLSLQTSVRQYVATGTWESPDIDTGVSGNISWKDLLSDYQANGQVVQYFLKSAATEGALAAAAYNPIIPGNLPAFASTDRWFKEKITMALLTGLDLTEQQEGTKTYEAEILPDAYNLTIHNSPDLDNSPFTRTGSGFYQMVTDATSTYGKALQLGMGNEGALQISFSQLFSHADTTLDNTTGWTAEFRVKLGPGILPYFGMLVSDGTQTVGVTIANSGVSPNILQLVYYTPGPILNVKASTTVPCNLNDNGWHTIRLRGKGTQFTVDLDGTQGVIATQTIASSLPGTKQISFGMPAGVITETNYLMWLSYLAWYAGGAVLPATTDDTITPVVYDTLQSWLSSPEGIVPASAVAAALWKNRYWCSETEINGTGENFNNVTAIYDTKGHWVFRRGAGSTGFTHGISNGFDKYVESYIGAMTVFQNNLWWVESNYSTVSGNNYTNILKLDIEGSTATATSVLNINARDRAVWSRGKENFGINRVKQFEFLKCRYFCRQPLIITATVDDASVTTFLLPASDGTQETVLYFLSDGRQIGVALQLTLSNSQNNNLPYFEFYSLSVQMSVMDYETLPQLGVTT